MLFYFYVNVSSRQGNRYMYYVYFNRIKGIRIKTLSIVLCTYIITFSLGKKILTNSNWVSLKTTIVSTLCKNI